MIVTCSRAHIVWCLYESDFKVYFWLAPTAPSHAMDAADAKDASEVGVHCSVCKALDFLPFTCSQCSLHFCRTHATSARSENHGCPVASSSSQPLPDASSSVTFKSLLPDRSHANTATASAEDLDKLAKKEAALAILHKNFPSTTGQPFADSSLSKPSPKPRSKAVLIMTLKRTAKSADPRKGEKQVPPADRRYVVARSEEMGKQVDVWLSKVRL